MSRVPATDHKIDRFDSSRSHHLHQCDKCQIVCQNQQHFRIFQSHRLSRRYLWRDVRTSDR